MSLFSSRKYRNGLKLWDLRLYDKRSLLSAQWALSLCARVVYKVRTPYTYSTLKPFLSMRSTSEHREQPAGDIYPRCLSSRVVYKRRTTCVKNTKYPTIALPQSLMGVWGRRPKTPPATQHHLPLSEAGRPNWGRRPKTPARNHPIRGRINSRTSPCWTPRNLVEVNFFEVKFFWNKFFLK